MCMHISMHAIKMGSDVLGCAVVLVYTSNCNSDNFISPLVFRTLPRGVAMALIGECRHYFINTIAVHPLTLSFFAASGLVLYYSLGVSFTTLWKLRYYTIMPYMVWRGSLNMRMFLASDNDVLSFNLAVRVNYLWPPSSFIVPACVLPLSSREGWLQTICW